MRIVNITSNFITNTRQHFGINLPRYSDSDYMKNCSAELNWMKCYKFIFESFENNSKQNSQTPFLVLILPPLCLFWFCLHEVWEAKWFDSSSFADLSILYNTNWQEKHPVIVVCCLASGLSHLLVLLVLSWVSHLEAILSKHELNNFFEKDWNLKGKWSSTCYSRFPFLLFFII